MDPAEAFLRAWPGPAPADRGALQAALETAWKSGSQRFAGLGPTAEVFAAWIATKIPADAPDVAAAVSGLRAAELLLTWACAAGDETAIQVFETEILPVVDVGLRKMRLDDTERAEVRQHVRIKLLTGHDPRIVRYDGRGDLRAWVRVVAVRAALNRKRDDWRHTPIEDAILADLPQPKGDPEAEAFVASYRVQFVSCTAAAFADLTRTQRNLMRQHHLDGLAIGTLAQAHGVHRVTASRWLTEAREALVAGLRARLAEALGLPGDQLDSVLGHLGTQVDFSVRRLLATPGGPGKKHSSQM